MGEPQNFTEEHEEWKTRLLIDYKETRDLFPHGGKNKTRRTKQFTITERTCEAWSDFITTYSGSEPSRGRGISSALVEVAQLLFMAVVAGFNVGGVAKKLKRIIPSEFAMGKLKKNLRKLEGLL